MSHRNAPDISLAASRNDKRRGEFIVHRQQVVVGIATHTPPELTNVRDDVSGDSGMHQTKLPVGFDELIVALGRVTDQLVCTDLDCQTDCGTSELEAMPSASSINRPERRPARSNRLAKMVQQFVIRKLATALQNDASRLVKTILAGRWAGRPHRSESTFLTD